MQDVLNIMKSDEVTKILWKTFWQALLLLSNQGVTNQYNLVLIKTFFAEILTPISSS